MESLTAAEGGPMLHGFRQLAEIPWRPSLVDASPARAPSAAELSHRRLQALYDVSRALPAVLDWAELVGRIVDVAVESVGAERGILFVVGADGAPRPERVRAADDATVSDAVAISRRILAHALSTGEATLSDDARADSRFASPSVVDFNIVSFMCVPLRRGDRVVGTLYVDHRRLTEQFAAEDLTFLTALGDIAAVALENARLHADMRREVDALRRDVAGKYRFDRLIGASDAMVQLFRVLERVADSDATVLIEGENGTGKELVARALHANSSRRQRPFVPVDCGALQESLAASELFGYKRGAFTGARDDHAGLFEQANGGTVFLDQIEDLPLSLLPHLLRALQEGEVRRVGETTYRKVSWRAVAASRFDLAEAVRRGRFREDLYYRLRVVPVRVPALRQRASDIPLLAEHFLEQARARRGGGPSGFTADALARMSAHPWPGNVRELEHAIHRAVLLASGNRIAAEDLALETAADPVRTGGARRVLEGGDVEAALREHRGNVSHAAEGLGITRRALQKIMRRHGLTRDSYTEERP